jgi:hypothetical protein
MQFWFITVVKFGIKWKKIDGKGGDFKEVSSIYVNIIVNLWSYAMKHNLSVNFSKTCKEIKYWTQLRTEIQRYIYVRSGKQQHSGGYAPHFLSKIVGSFSISRHQSYVLVTHAYTYVLRRSCFKRDDSQTFGIRVNFLQICETDVQCEPRVSFRNI